MMELYNITASEAIACLVDEIAEDKGISKALAKKLVLNSLLYNVVIAEISNQVEYLMNGAQG